MYVILYLNYHNITKLLKISGYWFKNDFFFFPGFRLELKPFSRISTELKNCFNIFRVTVLDLKRF